MKVILVAASTPLGFGSTDPRRLVVLAIKTSQGKASFRGLEYYLKEYPENRVSEWIIKASDFPSVLEHITFTFFIDGISRVCSHQLVRHRIASYTQESQRYSEERIVRCLECITSVVMNRFAEDNGLEEALRELVELGDAYYAWFTALSYFMREEIFMELLPDVLPCLEIAFAINDFMIEEAVVPIIDALTTYIVARYQLGLRPEDARYILPQCTKTSILMTVNLRELIHIACLRLSPRAQQEIRDVVSKMIDEVRKIVPEIDELIARMCRDSG